MSVIIVSPGFSSTNGLVKSTVNTANTFVDKGIDVVLLNIAGRNGAFEFLSPGYELDARVKKYSLTALSRESKTSLKRLRGKFYSLEQEFLHASYSMQDRDTLIAINDLLDESDILIFAHPLAAAIFFEAIEKVNAKTLLQIHGNFFEEVHNLELSQKYFDKLDYIQTVSLDMRTAMVNRLKLPPEKVIYIPNFFIPQQLLIPQKSHFKRISVIGSIQKRKNQLDAIKAIELLGDYNVILQIYGNGENSPYGKELQEYIRRRKLTGKVFFKGIATETEIYENTDIVLLPSLHEGFGYILLECAQYGIPVFAYNYEFGAPEFLSNNSQCLCNLGDFEALAQNIKKCFEPNFIENILDINRTTLKENFSTDHIFEMYQQVIPADTRNRSLEKLIQKTENIPPHSIDKMTLSVQNQRWGYGEKKIFFIFPQYKQYKHAKFYLYKESPINIERVSYRNVISRLINKNDAEKLKRYENSIFVEAFNHSDNDNFLPKMYDLTKCHLGMCTGFEKQPSYLAYINSKGVIERESASLPSYPQFPVKRIGSVKPEDITHHIYPGSIRIIYPSFEAITQIINEQEEPISYSTNWDIFNGVRFPSFSPNGQYKKITVETNSNKTYSIDFSEFTYSHIWHLVTQFEKRFDLFDIQIAKVNAWELIRAPLIETLNCMAGNWTSHFTKPEPIDFAYTGQKKLEDIGNANKLIFEFTRKKIRDKKTFHLQTSDAKIIEYPQQYGYSDAAYNTESNVYPIKQFFDFRGKFKFKFSREDISIIKKITDEFKQLTGLTVAFHHFFHGRIQKFMDEYNYFNTFFAKRNIGEVIIPSAYWSAGIVAAANKHGIKTSEVQYAMITHRHPSYDFEKNQRKYIPKQAYLWSPYWKHNLPYSRFIVPETNFFKNAYLDLKLDTIPEKYDIAFVSQPRIVKRFYNFVLRFAEKNPEHQIVLCLHPDEHLSSNDRNSMVACGNISISKEENLLAIAASKNVVCVYSTTTFEALALGKDVFILNLEGYQLLEREIEEKYVQVVGSVEELQDRLKKSSTIDRNFKNLFFNIT